MSGFHQRNTYTTKAPGIPTDKLEEVRLRNMDKKFVYHLALAFQRGDHLSKGN